MRLQKLHAHGNDFLVLLGSDPVTDDQVVALCARHTGIGADGLIRCEPTATGMTFELRNSDGSPAEVSGNGLRCAGLACMRAGSWDGVGTLTFATPAGERTVERVTEDAFRAGMGTIAFINDTEVNVGNPHEVHLLEGGLDEVNVATAALDRNVEWIVPGPGPDAITMRVHERGAGETMSCGSGSVAAAAVAHRAGWVGERVEVHNPGGTVVVELDGDRAYLTGPATWIADLEVDLPA